MALFRPGRSHVSLILPNFRTKDEEDWGARHWPDALLAAEEKYVTIFAFKL